MATFPSFSANDTGNYNRGDQGVFALYPAATSKYAVNAGLRDAENRETMARLYVELADTSDTAVQAYLAALPTDPATQSLARVLLGDLRGPSGGVGYIEFLLGQVQESSQEAVQIDKSLSDTFVTYSFGRNPMIWSFAGTLLNTLQDEQRMGFFLAYEYLLRASSCAKGGAVVHLRYDDFIITGVFLSSGQTLTAEAETGVSFSFQMLVWAVTPCRRPKPYIARVQTPFVQGVMLPSTQVTRDVRVRLTGVGSTTSTVGGPSRRNALLTAAQAGALVTA